MKDILKGFQIEDPISCVDFIKTIAMTCYEKVKEAETKSDTFKTANEYERLLQKSELKIRELIRVSLSI